MLQERIDHEHVIKGYDLREQIGEGGYGVVYRAYQPLVGRDVAVKIILPQYANHPDFIRRFEWEAQLVARLEHPYIVPLYDYWRDPDGAFLVMRWLRGGNLHTLLHDRPLPSDLLGRLIEQIGGALASAHRRGVVHRDLKPANILLDEEGNAYLADFGIAKDLGRRVSPYQTDASTVLGSPAYISPEQVRAEPITPQTDIYSLGVMLYEILTGQLPFHAPTPIALMFKHVNEPVPTVRAQRPDLSDAVNMVIQKATAKRPADRYADVTTLIQELRQALARGPAVTQRLADTQPIQPDPGNRTTSGTATRSKYETGVLYLPVPLAEPAEAEVENPYKGLRAFQEADADDFFGREQLTQLLLTRMQEQAPLGRFLAVVGPSGSGKSSVVRAGLVPAIRRGEVPGSHNWFVVEMFPSAHPVEELAQALMRVAVEPPNNLIGPLMLDEQGLLRVVDQVVPGADETEVVLLIDQFEEVFTLVEDEAVRTHFLGSLINAVTEPYSRIRVIVTLRADFYDRPLLYPGFSELMRQRTEVVVPLAPEELKQAIISPAERNGLRVDPELVEAIVNDVAEQPGALPLLQYALTEVFERRAGRTLTLTPYNASGGVLGALARRAEEIYTALSPEQQEAARQLFLRLVTLGEGVEDTRRRVRRTELATMTTDQGRRAQGSGDTHLSSSLDLDHVIEQYSQYRLLTRDNDPATRAPTVEVAHEALIRTWSRLRQWLDANRDDLRLQRRVTAAAAEWAASGHDRSFLASGARLEQLASWAHETHLALNVEERDYLSASMAERDLQQAQETARVAHEARLEHRSRTFLHALLSVAMLAALLGIGLSVYAFGQRQVALEKEQQALQSANIAQQNANQAATAEVQANTAANEASAQKANADAQKANAELNAAAAKQNAAEAQNLALASGAQVALNQGKGGNTDLALTLALAANQLSDPAPEARYTLSDAAYRPGTRTLFDGVSRMWAVAVSPDGTKALTAARDKTLTLWNLATGKKLNTFKGHTNVVRDVAFSPDGATAASASQDSTVILWDVASGTPKFILKGHGDQVHAVAFSPDGTTVLSGSDDNSLILWDAITGAMIRKLTGHTQGIGSVAYNPVNSKQAISASDDQTVRLWDLDTGATIRTFSGSTLEIRAAAFSPDGKRIAGGGPDNILYEWDVTNERPIHTFAGHTQQINSVAFTPNGKQILTGSNDSLLGVWDAEDGQVNYLNVSGQVSDVAAMPDSVHALSTSADGTMRLWDLTNGAQLQRLDERSAINRAALSADGKQLLVGLDDHTAQLQSLDSGAPPHVFSGHNDGVKDVAFSPDGKQLVSAANDGSMILWNASTGALIHVMQVPAKSSITAVMFSPDGKTLVTGGAGDNAVRLWDVVKGTEVISFTDHTDALNTVAFSPDGHSVLSASSDRTMTLWNVVPGKGFGQPLQTFKGHTAKVRDAAFTPDGKQILSASEDRTLILWDAASGKPIRRFTQHSDAVLAVALSADGRFAASGSADNTVILWDVATGRALRRFEGHTGAINKVLFSPDASKLFSMSNDKTIRVWRIDSPEALVAWANANRYHPELTCEQEQLYKLPTTHCTP